MHQVVKKSLAELTGTFVMMLFGCGAITVADQFGSTSSPQAVAIAFGGAVAVMIYAVGHISGAHFNPAVTLALAIGGHFPRRQVLPYWVAQFAGAAAAMLALTVLLPDGRALSVTAPKVTLWQALSWEMLLTFVLMFVIVAVATDGRAQGTMAGAAIGGTVALAAMVGGPVTGASMNPARSLIPALASWEFTHVWIYVVGPVVGAGVAVLLYGWIRCVEPEDRNDAKGCC